MTQDHSVNKTRERTQATMEDLASIVELLQIILDLVDKKSRAQALELMRQFLTTMMMMTLILELAWLKLVKVQQTTFLLIRTIIMERMVIRANVVTNRVIHQA
jgi:hypothetical protein